MFALYKEGDTHKVDGIKCSIIRVELGELDAYRADGWMDDISELGKAKEHGEKPTKVKLKK